MMLLALALSPTATVGQQPDSSNAYMDAAARELVRLARERRTFVDRSITKYDATVKERVSVGLRMRLTDRLAYRRETATRIEWQRGGPINVTALGAREGSPLVSADAWVPGDLDFLPTLAFDPMNADGLMRVNETVLRHPLADGAEAHYRYQTGGSTTIGLDNNRTIKLVELRVHPRRADVRLLSGSFWIDAATHSVVQVVFRLAKDFDFELRRDSNSVNMVDRGLPDDSTTRVGRRPTSRVWMPGFVKPMRAELQYVTIEYGLMQLRWWLPRLIAAEGVFQAGSIRTPVHFERTYSYERVVGDTSAALIARSSIAMDTATPGISRPCRARPEAGIPIAIEGDSAWTARYRKQMEERHQRIREARDSAIARGDTARARRLRDAEACRDLYRLTIPDSAALIASAELPPSIYGDKAELTGSAELTKLIERIKSLPVAPWQLRAPRLTWGFGGNGLIRYNKVEGLSVGARQELDLGRLRTDLTAHFGFADLQPKLQLGITRGTPETLARLGIYRRLDVMDQPAIGGLGASLKAVLFGEDDRDYYRTTGLEFIRRPAESDAQWYDLRLFAEEQRSVSRETNFSVAHLIDSEDTFEPNLRADRADQAGGQFTVRASAGQNPEGFRFGAELSVLGSGGTFDFTRESALLRVGFPLPLRLRGALEGAAGTSTGLVPIQSLWYLGGSHSVRGYDAGALSGSAFWRGRAEISNDFPAARLVGFTDFGWAGGRDQIARRASLLSVGVGGSFFDGALRLDLARALRGNTAWRLHLSLDGIL